MPTYPPPEIFKAYDVRGLYGDQIDGDVAEGVGRAFARVLADLAGKPTGELRVGLGRDMRLTAPELAARYRAGMVAEGAHVLDAGMVGTEMLYFLVGSRFLDPDGARQGGMPWWKRAANRGLTSAENRLMGTELSELHTGYRAFSRKLLLEVPFLRNSLDFAFDTELLMQAAYFGFRFHEVPCATIYNNEASSVSFRQGVVYGVKSLGTGARLVLHRRGIWRSKKFQA